ncbi:sigma-54-dependent transcriptional regulator [Pseudothauera lacus]|uniref:Sigma-54-dependent Fis family transcriptional regulator n=1 Tax=Pseudothauera lacus TaxID=2136175 RepID=A0A2T4IFJ2_9RHOO|nr:sigma-54 dependent transcriptional regulator [Pseudothauera lacus]PTD96527.1 sigma-54-dependent Fis family transcriptional regulator [Pseudothauera lacus]
MSKRPRLCLIEDDEIMGESLSDRFELEGFAFDWYRCCGDAEAALREGRYDVVLSDIRLPDRGGDELYLALQGGGLTLPPWYFITGHGAIDRAVALLKAGATDYITKPFDLDALVDKLAEWLVPRSDDDACRLGVSAGMRHIETLLPRIATQARTVLLSGESGVGKEVVARELHRLAGGPAASPFIAVNCGAIPETLLEAELFGHEKGAFTGAQRVRAGVFEQAHGGTLFLDEIGDMPLPMQVRLLRVIQERNVVRVGGTRALPVDLRLICATHRDLQEMVEEGSFREDLYYRIHVIHLKVPPLRERREDIPWLAHRLLEAWCREHPGERKRLSPQVEQALQMHQWPGNVRELKHAIERACILSEGNELDLAALFETPLPGELLHGDCGEGLQAYLQSCERAFVSKVLDGHDWQIARSAEALGISRKNLWERMRRLGLSAPAAPRD